MIDVATLRKARSIISAPAHWTQGTYARNPQGKKISIAEATLDCSFCMVGAMAFAAGRVSAESILRDLEDLRVYALDLTTINDSRPHTDVLVHFDRVIERVARRLRAS